MLLFFRTRGGRVFFVGRAFPDQIIYLASALYYDASEKMECGGLMVIVQICKNISVLVIFYRLSIGFGTHTCRLALDLEICSIEFGICN